MRQLTKRPTYVLAASTDKLTRQTRFYGGGQYVLNGPDDSVTSNQMAVAGTLPSYLVKNVGNLALPPEKVGLKQVELTAEERRVKRMDALMKMRDLWDKSNPGIGPIDGVEYQKAMRAEW
jgi:hypothetical protein